MAGDEDESVGGGHEEGGRMRITWRSGDDEADGDILDDGECGDDKGGMRMWSAM